MSVAAPAMRRGLPAAKKDRTLHKLGLVLMLITLLTSETVWARFLNMVGGDDMHFAEAAPPPLYGDREMAQLIMLTESSGPTSSLTPTEAIERNEAIPFGQAPVASAKPFRALMLHDGAGLTALRCLTQAVYYEAGFEPLLGRRAVAQVVLNRMRHPAFPNSVCGVVYQGVNRPVCQFSFTCDGSLKRRPDPAKWQESEAVARAALDGYVEPSVGHSTHYHANYVSPYWAPKLVKIARIGAHIFYRWPGKWGQPSAFSGQHAGYEAIPAILPRAFLGKRIPEAETEAQAQARTIAEARLPGNLVPDNHAESDVGGRLDVSKGWMATIPEPEDTYHSSRMIARQQAGEYETTKGGGS